MKNRLRTLFGNGKHLKEEISFPGGIIPIQNRSPQDIYIVGFPKSGNTLMQHVIAHLVYGLNSEVSRSMVNLIVPDIYANTHYFRFNDVCFFKSHERPDPDYKNVIYLLRDGRDALLSYYHMMKNMGKEISLEDLYRGQHKIFGGTWSEHVNLWDENPYNANILFVKFEDLKFDKMSQLVRICEFLNLTRSESELNDVLKMTSIETMKKLEQKNDWKKMKQAKNFDQGNFVRKGEVNSFGSEVGLDLLEFFIENSQNNFYNFK